MNGSLVCANCGSPVKPDSSFCGVCGSPIEAAVVLAPSGVSPIGVPDSKDDAPYGRCSTCNMPAKAAGQKFCANCGGPIAQTASAGVAFAAPIVPGPVSRDDSADASGAIEAPTVAASTSQESALTNFQSKFNDFMGSSIDVSNVGVGFDPSSIKLSEDGNAAISRAFAFFGKSFKADAQTAFNPDEELVRKVESRNKARAEKDAEARNKEKRDFSATDGFFNPGSMTSKLQPAVAPSAKMVSSEHDKAFSNTDKSRLKHKVALGELEQSEAVALYEKDEEEKAKAMS